jgi:hypothetical protein
MMQVRRTGPATVVGATGGIFRFTVPLNCAPTRAWWIRFQFAPPIDGITPQTVGLEGNALRFASSESEVDAWVRRLDLWIAAANAGPMRRLEHVGFALAALLLITGTGAPGMAHSDVVSPDGVWQTGAAP